jgi:hypothetical protein
MQKRVLLSVPAQWQDGRGFLLDERKLTWKENGERKKWNTIAKTLATRQRGHNSSRNQWLY